MTGQDQIDRLEILALLDSVESNVIADMPNQDHVSADLACYMLREIHRAKVMSGEGLIYEPHKYIKHVINIVYGNNRNSKWLVSCGPTYYDLNYREHRFTRIHPLKANASD